MAIGLLPLGHCLLMFAALQDPPECRVCPIPTGRVDVPANPNVKLWAAIYVSNPVVHPSQIDRLQLYFVVVNDGPTVADPRVGASHLLINGTEPRAWSLQINNGVQTSSFTSLPPGKILEFSIQLGPAYFRKPGIYSLKWKGPDFTSPEMTFRVLDH